MGHEKYFLAVLVNQSKMMGCNVGILVFSFDAIIIILGYVIAHIPLIYSVITVIFVGFMTITINSTKLIVSHNIRI